jgi:hypothetical protein
VLVRLRNIKRVARDGDWRKCWVGEKGEDVEDRVS